MTRKATGKRNAAASESDIGLDWAVAGWVIVAGVLCILAMVGELLRVQSASLLLAGRCIYLFVLIGCIAGSALRLTRWLRSRRDGGATS